MTTFDYNKPNEYCPIIDEVEWSKDNATKKEPQEVEKEEDISAEEIVEIEEKSFNSFDLEEKTNNDLKEYDLKI